MEKRQHRQKEVLMTEGPIWRCLLLLALPLMAGNLFQQLYNTVDSIVVGNFVGKEALAAVGSTDSVINTFIGFFPACPPVQASSFPNIMAAKKKKRFLSPSRRPSR